MSALPLELAVPTTAPAPAARGGSSSGVPTGTDAQSGKDFATLVAQALGLARPGTEQTPTTVPGTEAPAGKGDPTETDTTPKTGTPTPAQQGADTTAADAAPDAPAPTDQAARDAVVAALGLTLVAVPVPAVVPNAAPTTAPTTGPATTPAGTTTTATDASTPGPSLRPTPSATSTPADASTDPKAAETDPKATPTAPAAAQAPAAPVVAGQPAVTTTVATAAAALAAAAAATTGAGLQDGAKDGHQDGQDGKKDAAATTATSGAGTATAPADAPATAVTATTGDTVAVVASGPVVVTPAVQATQAAAGRVHGAHHVATQVIPEITRLVSDGEGVHRVTLQLNPRALGDVRVVLTMRQGDVHVRLVAGDDARAALASSSSELTRALDQLGLKDHRISLSSLSDPSATTWSSGSDQTNDPRQHAQHPGGLDADLQDQKNAQHLWMGDDSTATDGMNPSNPAGRTSRSVPVPTFGATPAGALDVRM